MTDDPHEVRITLREVWDLQQRQNEMLTKMASDLARFLDAHDRVARTVDDHEERIRSMERKVWQWSGGAALAGALLGTLINLFVK